jgi:O-antigen/teichoic acid export membrane protein
MNNSIWGVVSNIIQNLLFSIFFVIIARIYTKAEFGQYVIANTMYSFMLAFSSLGLGHWFIREVINQEDQTNLTRVFFKIQFLIGVLFYGLNIITVFLLYEDTMIRSLSLIIGINLIFDNLINVIKSLNIAHQEQKKTFKLLTLEALLKCLVSLVLLIYPMNLMLLSGILIFLRLITLNLFIRMGTATQLGYLEILTVQLNWGKFRDLIFSNWAFIVISSMSVLNWRIGNIIVSKKLSLDDVAHYEISFKLFSLAYLIPIIVTQTLYPILIRAFKVSKTELKVSYQKAYWPLFIYGFAAFTFVYAYADFLLPWLFGNKYEHAAFYCKQMFAVLLIFPTVILQANVLLTLKLEKLDMLCNILSVVINLIICVVGLSLYHDLSVINVAIFCSFLIFHLIQDIILIRNGVTKITHVIGFYVIASLAVISYILLDQTLKSSWTFVLFWMIIILMAFPFLPKLKRFFLPNY